MEAPDEQNSQEMLRNHMGSAALQEGGERNATENDFEDDGDQEGNDDDGVEANMDDVDIVPSSKPPTVPEDGTYITALNEAGVDPERIEQLRQSKFLVFDL